MSELHKPHTMAELYPRLHRALGNGVTAQIPARLDAWSREDLLALRDEVKSFHDHTVAGIDQAANEDRARFAENPALREGARQNAVAEIAMLAGFLEGCIKLSLTRLEEKA